MDSDNNTTDGDTPVPLTSTAQQPLQTVPISRNSNPNRREPIHVVEHASYNINTTASPATHCNTGTEPKSAKNKKRTRSRRTVKQKKRKIDETTISLDLNIGLKKYILNKWSLTKDFVDVSSNTIESLLVNQTVPLELSVTTNQLIDKLVPTFYDLVNNKIYEIVIPDKKLSKLTHVTLRTMNDLKQIPNERGCYWIMTNEPINHCFNSGNHCPGVLSDGFSVVYNGVAAEMRGRAKQHLLRQGLKGSFGSASGISVDLLKETDVKKGVSKSHVKWMWQNTHAAKKRKLPKILKGNQYCQIQRDTSKQEILNTLNLSQTEKEMATKREELIFKNGIDVTDEKHAVYTWKFVFVPISDHGLRDCVERKWRNEYGVPILCTYKDGR